MNEITKQLLEVNSIKNYFEKIKKEIDPSITILGLSDVSKAVFTSLVFEQKKQTILLVSYNELMTQKLYKNLKKINPNTIYIPKKDIITYEYDVQSMDILTSRIEGITKIYNNQAEIVILSIETLMQPILSKKEMQNSILKLMVANQYDFEEIKEKLVHLGYERCDLVEGKGTFSLRGDILDVAISNKTGIRIEFFGDEVDQIRYFDIASQRSTENINQVKIFPLSEEIEKEPKSSILEYLPEKSIIVFDEISKINLRSENILNDNVLLIKDLVDKNKNIPFILENMFNADYLNKKASDFNQIYLESQDILTNRENVISTNYEDIRQIDEKFYEITKQEKEQKTYKPRTRHSSEFREAEKVTFSDLKVGDYVVHRTHGIGVYIGVNTITADGVTKDYIKIKYTGEDVLYIPTNSLDNIRKYIGGGEKAPKINKLGSKEWENTKNKVKSNLREVARNLIELYATRQKVQGFAYDKDTPWQKEFEDTFPYEETEDQLRCIEEVKRDMESPKPMDRLLCGDVGYRKNRSSYESCFQGMHEWKTGSIPCAYNNTCKPTI